MKNKKTIKKKKKPLYKESDFYCKDCGGCGYIGCDGIREFLNKHVKGKTTCLNEQTFIDEIINYIEN